MADWLKESVSDPDENKSEEETEENGQKDFQSHFDRASENPQSISIGMLKDGIDEIENIENLETAISNDDREEAVEIYESRLEDLGVETETEDEKEESEEQPKEENSDPFGIGSEPTEDDEKSENSEESEETDSVDQTDVEEEEEDSEQEPTIESGEESVDTNVEESTPETEVTSTDGGSQTDDSSDIDVKSIAPGVITAEEAADRERRFTMMVWSDPGMGKTHFSCTGPEPVVIIDTEGKADEVAGKFRGEGEISESPFILQPTDYDEAIEALNSALDILDEFRRKKDMTGTLVVDSMSVMWGWSQQKYVDKYYPGKDAEEVEFNSAIGGGQSDWKQIKRYHNVKFRQPMIDSPYHLIWTAMREDDYEERMKGNRDADKPAGEKENPYKVDEVLRIKEGEEGAPVGVLNKSGKIKHRYAGLRYPTFEKHRDLLDDILDAENGSRSPQAVAGEHGVRIHEGNPEYEEED